MDFGFEIIGEIVVKMGKFLSVKCYILLCFLGISLWGWIKLVLLCVLVGFFVMVSEFDLLLLDVDVMGVM